MDTSSQLRSNHLTSVLVFSTVTHSPSPMLPSQYAFPDGTGL